MKKIASPALASAGIALLSVALLFTAVSPCPPPAMKCVNTTNVIIGLYAATCVLSGATFCLSGEEKSRRLITGLTVLTICCLVAAITMPTVMGGCMRAEMRCRSLTFPYVCVSAAIMTALQVLQLYALRARKSQK